MRVLVVDDMPLMRHVLINMLKRLGMDEIKEAIDGKQALRLIEQHSFNLVITDLNMPKISGKELFLTIKNDPKLAHIPVMIVTCEDNKEIVTDLIQAKVNGLLLKPFNLNTLKKQLSLIGIESSINNNA